MQAQQVLQLINDKNKLVHERFRGVVMYQMPDWFTDAMKDAVKEQRAVALKSRMKKIQDMQDDIYKKAQPASHRFELKAMK